MVNKRVTSQQVAERAGVSRTTVSFVLNDVQHIQIREETRQRVKDVARDLGYVPNEAARSLVSGQTMTLALVLCMPPEQITVDAYMPMIVHGISDVAHQDGFRVLIEWVEDVTNPDAYINLARARKIDGIIVGCPRLDDVQLPRLIQDGFPTVILGTLPNTQATYVDADNDNGTKQAMQHLLDLGHSRIACVTNSDPIYTAANTRLVAYRSALEVNQIPYDPALVRYANFNPDSGYEAMQDLLRSNKNNLPTAVFIASDEVAFGALAAIRDEGLRVPEDIAVVSFDDVPLAKYIDPPLTTVRLSAIEQGRIACQMLIELIQGVTPSFKQVSLDAELIVRESCGVKLPAN